jgi:maleate cis-trans isomerase
LYEFGHGVKTYGWRARIGNISPTACAEILSYEFYRVAPEGVTFVTTNLVIRDARESSQVEASWRRFDTAFEDLLHTRVDHITLSGAVLITSSAWPTLTVIQALEDDLGKPVVSSSIGQIWWPLKELAIKAEIRGYGKLLGTLS